MVVSLLLRLHVEWSGLLMFLFLACEWMVFRLRISAASVALVYSFRVTIAQVPSLRHEVDLGSTLFV
jgi:hypothetical protein